MIFNIELNVRKNMNIVISQKLDINLYLLNIGQILVMIDESISRLLGISDSEISIKTKKIYAIIQHANRYIIREQLISELNEAHAIIRERNNHLENIIMDLQEKILFIKKYIVRHGVQAINLLQINLLGELHIVIDKYLKQYNDQKIIDDNKDIPFDLVKSDENDIKFINASKIVIDILSNHIHDELGQYMEMKLFYNHNSINLLTLDAMIEPYVAPRYKIDDNQIGGTNKIIYLSYRKKYNK